MYMRELRVSYRRRRLAYAFHGRRLRSPSDAAPIITALIGSDTVEAAVVLCVTAKHDLIAYHRLSRGTVDATIIHPRDVFRIALLANATGVLIGHNHPSGDPNPSDNDVILTRRLISAGEVVGIDVLDHIIVAADGYLSLKESGLI